MMSVTAQQVAREVNRIIKSELGPDCWDMHPERVTDIIVGYADGSDDNAVIVLGDWNDSRYPRNDDPPLTEAERVGPRLFDALEAAGAECQWLDEYSRCSDCGKAIRTEPDSYRWRPEYIITDDYTCARCLRADPLGAITGGDYINNSANAITWLDAPALIRIGCEQWAPGEAHTYASGWHEGMADDPTKVLAEIRREAPGRDVVFLIDETSQFYTRFSAWLMPLDGDYDA